MNWPASLLAGFAGTLVLTSLEAGAQQLRLTRMSIPYLLGAMLTPSRDRAKLFSFGKKSNCGWTFISMNHDSTRKLFKNGASHT